MKLKLLALAMLAAAGPVMAQSSVTIYGRVVLGAVKDTANESARLDYTSSTNQLGFRGVEDLGGGLKATFDLLHRFSPESGGLDGTNNQRPFWAGGTKVGLAGSFGSVEVGRMLTALQIGVNGSSPWGIQTVGAISNLASVYSTDARQPDGAGAGRTDVIHYTSPRFGGFQGALSYGLKTSAAAIPRTTAQDNLISAWLNYTSGPVMAAGGLESNRVGDDISAILGSYDFGFAKVMAGYSHLDTAAVAGSKRKNWNLGLSVPVGATVIKAGYNQSKAEGTGARTRKIGFGGEYNLSKRTYLFATLGRTRAPAAASFTAWDLGISHSF